MVFVVNRRIWQRCNNNLFYIFATFRSPYHWLSCSLMFFCNTTHCQLFIVCCLTLVQRLSDVWIVLKKFFCFENIYVACNVVSAILEFDCCSYILEMLYQTSLPVTQPLSNYSVKLDSRFALCLSRRRLSQKKERLQRSIQHIF